MCEIGRAGDQGDMGESLREVADQALLARIVFLGQQAEVVPQRQKPFEEPSRRSSTAEQDEIIDEPEAAGEERTLPARQSVLCVSGIIAADETVLGKMALDCLHRAPHP